MRKSNESLNFRGAQLDLARQPETLGHIRSFIDFISQHEFNHLVLYLEGRIRTRSFPYRQPSASYAPDDIKTIVEYADHKKMNVVPVVSTLGHAEQFLDCPELEHLAELRGDRAGRFSTKKHVFCPTLPETNEFFEAYLTEVAELFPSEYFHAGFDEAWDIGYCDLCRERLKTETQADIFAKQILDIHAIVAGKLKKTMIIWDDLFDVYPEALERLPRDIVMCAWHYDKLVETPAGHFGGPKRDKLAQYKRLGFPCLFAPAVFSMRNIETFSSYAMPRSPLGGLLTAWESTREFPFSGYPSIAYAGRLWSGRDGAVDPGELQAQAVRDLTRQTGEAEIAAIKNALDSRHHGLPAQASAYMRGPLSDPERERARFVEIAAALFANALTNVQGLAADVLEDLSIRMEIEKIYFSLRELISEWYGPSVPKERENVLRDEAEVMAERLRDLQKRRGRQWDAHRPGLSPRGAENGLKAVMDMLTTVEDEASRVTALLKVSLPGGSVKADFLLRSKGSAEWIKVGGGAFNSNPFVGPYQIWLPIFEEVTPVEIRIESCGYVGSRIAFVAVETATDRFVSAAITAIEGTVVHPEALLENGRDHCFLGDGEQAARRKFNNPPLSAAKNSVALSLQIERSRDERSQIGETDSD